MVWEVKHLRFHPVNAAGLPGAPLHLIVARDVLNPEERDVLRQQRTRGNVAPDDAARGVFAKQRGAAVLEDQRGEIGLDQYEGRRYQGLKRHLILSCISYLFLSRMRQEFRGEIPA